MTGGKSPGHHDSVAQLAQKAVSYFMPSQLINSDALESSFLRVIIKPHHYIKFFETTLTTTYSHKKSFEQNINPGLGFFESRLTLTQD